MVNKLAEKVKKVGEKLGYKVEIQHLPNPCKEAEKYYYNLKYTGLLELKLETHYLTDEVLEGMFKIEHKNNIKTHKIFRGIKW